MFNKTIIVFYVDVGHLSPDETNGFMKNIQQTASIKTNGDLSEEEKKELIEYFIPIRNQGQTRIEILNQPIFITTEEEKYRAMLKMEQIDNKLDKITSVINVELEKREVLVEKSVTKIFATTPRKALR